MLSIGAMSASQEDYYLNLAREDYYLNGGEPPGNWLGVGANNLGLKGLVTREALQALFRGESPGGKALVQNARRTTGQRKRDPGWDLTFSVPKSVSVLWSQAEERLRQQIQQAVDKAVQKAVGYLEEEAAYCRMGKAGRRRVKAKLTVATFVHGTSRALDPQYHVHCLVINAGVCPDGKVRALMGRRFYQHKMVAGAFFRAALAHELQEQLGVRTFRPLDKNRKPRSTFEIKGIPETLIKFFSKRRQAIEESLGALGLASAAAAAVATLNTRENKEIVPPRKELLQEWQAEGIRQGFTQNDIRKLMGRLGGTDPQKQASRYQHILRQAIAELTYAESHFSEQDLLRRTLEISQSYGMEPKSIQETLRRDLQNPQLVVALGQKQGVVRYSTEAVLETEKQLLNSVDTLRQREFKPLDDKVVKEIIENPHYAGIKGFSEKVKAHIGLRGEAVTLNAEQAAALHYLTQEPGRVKILNGFAGVGKTTLLSATREAYEKQGYRVLGTSVAGVAAQGMQMGAAIESDTVKMRLMQLDPEPARVLAHHAGQLARAALQESTHAFERLKIDAKTVLIVDEAGMLGTKEFARLAQAVEKGGGILICAGDHRQLPSIEAGGGFASIARRVGQVELQEISRQTDSLERETVKALTRSEAKLVLNVYAERGKLYVAENCKQSAERLVQDWREGGGVEEPGKHVILVATNQEVEHYNDLAQQQRANAGKLDLRHPVKIQEETFYPGDRVLFTQKSRKLGVENGNRGTLLEVKSWGAGTSVVVQMDHNKESRVIPVQQLSGKSYTGLKRGYAFTTHKLQGATVDHAYVHLGGRMTNREMAYVQGSRHRESLMLYTEELEAGRELTRNAREHRHHDLLADKRPEQKVEKEHSQEQEKRQTPAKETPLERDDSPLIQQMDKSRAKTLAHDILEENRQRRQELEIRH